MRVVVDSFTGIRDLQFNAGSEQVKEILEFADILTFVCIEKVRQCCEQRRENVF